MLNLYWDLCLEPAWYWGGWSHFLEDLFRCSCSPSKGELSGSCLVMAHTLMCILVRSLALRWELRTWETSVVGPNSNSNTKRDKSNAAFCLDNIEIICNVRKNIFYTDIYQNFLFLEKLWLFKFCAPEESTQSMTVSQDQSLSYCCPLSSSPRSVYKQGEQGNVFALMFFALLCYTTPCQPCTGEYKVPPGHDITPQKTD